jgi:proteic killer suppression protein
MKVINTVVLSKNAKKQIERIPQHVAIKFLAWVSRVEKVGLEDVRKIPGFHDEPLKGKLAGLRSIRLSRGYRAYYRVVKEKVEFVYVEGVDKHEYKG